MTDANAGPTDPTASTGAAHSLMQAIIATATEGIVSMATDGRIETVNRATERLFGYGPDELIGRDVTLLMPSPYREEHDGYVRRYLNTGEPRIIGRGREVRGRRKDGSEFPVDLSVGEGFVGSRRFFVAIVRDITERKELQAKLALAERLSAIGELAAGVAHEINNPINTILNCTQLIADGEPAGEQAEIIAAESQRIAAIVHDLLDFARDDRARPQPTAIVEVVDRTTRLLSQNLDAHGIDLTVAVEPDLPLVLASPQQLQQALLNLLINAKDALVQAPPAAASAPARPPRRIRIGTATEHGGVLLWVQDNGPGVAPDLGGRIFEPFVTTKRGRGGTGLGLSITKNIVEHLGGSISVRSEPGQGAEFRIWLPVAPSTALRPEAPGDAPPPGTDPTA